MSLFSSVPRCRIAQLALIIAASGIIGLHMWTRPDARILSLRAGPELFVGANFSRLKSIDPRLSGSLVPRFEFRLSGRVPVPDGIDSRDVWGLAAAGRIESEAFVLDARYLYVPVLGYSGSANRVLLVSGAKTIAADEEETGPAVRLWRIDCAAQRGESARVIVERGDHGSWIGVGTPILSSSRYLGREKHNALLWSALATALAILFLPGVSLLTTKWAQAIEPALAAALLPLPGLCLVAACGLMLWVLRRGHDLRISSMVAMVLIAGAVSWIVVNLGRGGSLRVRWASIVAYLATIAVAIGYSLLPAQVAGESFPNSSMRSRMVASPPDNVIPFFTAAFLIHDKDPRADTAPYFWGWGFASRGPFMAWVEAAALNVEGLLPSDPPRAELPGLVDPQGFFVGRLYGIITNAMVVLAAGALLVALGAGGMGFAFGLAWVALCPGTFINVSFLWPKLLATFFLIVSFVLVRNRRGRIPWAAAALCAALGYLTHPVSGFLVPPLILLAASSWSGAAPWRVRMRRAAALAGLAAVLVSPWLIYKWSLHQPDPFLNYPFGDGRGMTRAASAFSWMQTRYSNAAMTLVPFEFMFSQAMYDWQGLHLDQKLRWVVQSAKTLPGELGFALFWLAYLRLAFPRHESARRFRDLALVLPFAGMIVFWGFSGDGLGRNCLEPLFILTAVYASSQEDNLALRNKVLLFALGCESLFVALAPLR